MVEDRLSEKKQNIFNCFLNPEIFPMVVMTGGSLFHSVRAATVKLHNPEHLFGLDEEVDM